VYTEPLERSLRRAIYEAVDGARHHIYLENPYPTDNGLVLKLARARRRGVDVRVVLTIQGETSSTNHANRVLASRLVRAGVRVYLYPDLLHTKALAVDGCRVYLGTGNFDGLSLRRNHELGVVIESSPLIAEVEERVFLADFRPEWELTEPLRLSPVDYFYEIVASAFL
jgi:cardiolipin synthase